MSARDLAATLEAAITTYVPGGFRAANGVWHEGPRRRACLDALDALVELADDKEDTE